MRPRSEAYFDALTYATLAATVLVAAAAFVGPFAAFTQLLYPVLALSTAVLLIWRKPATYIGFMWWVWFLTPEVRRLVDYRVGYTEVSPVMLAPFLVTALGLVAVLVKLPKLPRPYRLPLAFVAFGLLYAYAVGVLNNSPVATTFDLLVWGVPVISGAYVLTEWEHAASFRAATQRAFMWGILVMGVYSVYQYFFLPPWDGYWMDNAGLGSIGASEPQQVRVFSTLNSPGPFATVVMAGLLLAFSSRGVVGVLGAAAGFVGFALSAVRSAWGGWFVGFLTVAASLPLRLRTRLLGTLLLLGVIAVPLFTVGPVADLLSQRLNSVTNLQEDTSFNDRLGLYTRFSSFTSGNWLGQGLGSTGVATGLSSQTANLQDLDSGIIAVIYTFGLLGTLYYVGGALVLFGAALRSGLRSRDLVDAAYIGITVGTLSQLVFGNVWGGAPGMILWFFPCLYLASRQERQVNVAVGSSHTPKRQVAYD